MAKWPTPGGTLPVTVDQADTGRCKVRFIGQPPAAPVEDDRVAQVERLAKLKDSRALTDEEFESEKARILCS